MSLLLALPLCNAFTAPPSLPLGQPAAQVQRSPAARLSSSPPARGTLLRVVHRVEDVDTVANFYSKAFGFDCDPVEGMDERARKRVAGSADTPQLELVSTENGAYIDGASYQGLSLRVPDVADAVSAALEHGGSVIKDTKEIEHGPSNEPEEDDNVVTLVVEAVVSDPSGFPVHLYQADCTQGTITGVRLDVYEWKQSSEWYAAELGWRQVRWQSNLVREASFSVLMGEPDCEGVPGPVGALTDDQPSPVLSLCYKYGCKPYSEDTGLEAIVLSAGDGSPTELQDLDSNQFQFA